MTVRIHRAETALFRIVGDEAYLTAAGSREIARLTGSAATAWILLEDPLTVDELVRFLAELHSVEPDAIGPEVRSFVDDLVQRGWVRGSR